MARVPPASTTSSAETTTRPYLLAGPLNRTIAIELSDFTGGADLDELDAVGQRFEFSDPAP